MVTSTKLIVSQPTPTPNNSKRLTFDNELKHPNRTFSPLCLRLFFAIDFAATATHLSETFVQNIVRKDIVNKMTVAAKTRLLLAAELSIKTC